MAILQTAVLTGRQTNKERKGDKKGTKRKTERKRRKYQLISDKFSSGREIKKDRWS